MPIFSARRNQYRGPFSSVVAAYGAVCRAVYRGLPMHLAANSLFLLAQARDPGFFEKFLGSPAGSLIPFLAVGFVFYFLLMRPERRKRQELEKMLEGLNKDDQVVTIGGIWGVVVNAAKGSEFITVRVDEGSGAKLRILRSAVSRVITDGTAGKEGST